MSEIERIARLLEQTLAGSAYDGPAAPGTLEGATATMAARKPLAARAFCREEASDSQAS